jgi:hypothetical protein
MEWSGFRRPLRVSKVCAFPPIGGGTLFTLDVMISLRPSTLPPKILRSCATQLRCDIFHQLRFRQGDSGFFSILLILFGFPKMFLILFQHGGFNFPLLRFVLFFYL